MSNSFNAIVRVGRDGELRTTPAGHSVLGFTAANSIGWGDKKQTLWLSVSYWRKPENLAQYIKKGVQLMVSGEISQEEYAAKDGTMKTVMRLNANTIELIGGQQQPAQQVSAMSPGGGQQQAPTQGAAVAQDDIPFVSLTSLIKAHVI